MITCLILVQILLPITIFVPISMCNAFCPSSSPCKMRKYQTYATRQSRRKPFLPKSIVLSNRSNTDKYPVHVLWDYYRPQDSLVSGIAEIGIGFSIGVLYSEYSIIA